MKRKIADVGPRYNQEEAERLKAILRTRADDQFELDKLFADSPTVRHQTRQKLERLLIQAEAAETMAPGLQRDMSKMASVTDEEAKILGLEKTALKGETVGRALAKRMLQGKEKKIYGPWIGRRPHKASGVAQGIASQGIRVGGSEPGFTVVRRSKLLQKSASIAPNVDAWFEKNAAAIKQAAIPSPAIGAKAVRVTASARPGRVPAQSNLAGGSA